MLKITRLFDKPVSSKNNSSRLASSKNNNSKPLSRKNNNNNKVNGFNIGGNGVEYTKKSRKLSKSEKLKSEKMSKF